MRKEYFYLYPYILPILAIVLSAPLLSFAQISDEDRARLEEQAQGGVRAEQIQESVRNTIQDRIQNTSSNGTEPSDDWSEPTLQNNNTRPVADMAQERLQAPEERRDQMRTDIATRQADIQARGEERRTALQERAQERLLNLAANMSNRMEAAIRRLTNVAERLESRMEKLEQQGVNTVEARRQLTNATERIASARASLANIDTDVVQFITSSDPRASWMRVRSIYDSARTDIMAAHNALRATLTSLGQAIAEQEAANQMNDNVLSNE